MITVVSGTTRKASRTIQIAKVYAQLLDEVNEPNEIVDLASFPVLINESSTYHRGTPSAEYQAIQQQLIDASKLVFVVPEYNGSFPGVLKTFIDSMPFPNTWKAKKVGLIGLGSGVQGGVLAMSHLTDIFHYMNAEVMGFKPKLNFIHQHLQDGIVNNELFMQMLREHAERMQKY